MPQCCYVRGLLGSGLQGTSSSTSQILSHPPPHPAPPMSKCSSNGLPQGCSQNPASSRRRREEAAASLPTPSAFKSTWKPLRLGEESSFGRCRQTAKQLLSICSFAQACISNCVFRTQAMLGAPLDTDNLKRSCHLCGFLLWSIGDLAGFSPSVLLVVVCRMSVCLLASHLIWEAIWTILDKIWSFTSFTCCGRSPACDAAMGIPPT